MHYDAWSAQQPETPRQKGPHLPAQRAGADQEGKTWTDRQPVVQTK